jgi:hypothetical protein
MLKKIAFPIVAAAILALGVASAGESTSEMLEKGIYTEETVGDLDAAIKIYDKIISEARANRKFVAQAQFRRGQCLLKQGKKDEAQAAFEEFVNQFKDFPDQKELVAKARKLVPDDSSGLELDPVPWADGEHLELRIKLGSGLDIGNFVLSARSGKVGGREVWNLGLNRNIGVNAPNLGLSQIVADCETFRPVSSVFSHYLLGNVAAEYAPNQVTIRSKGVDGKESTRKLDLDGAHYDNEQAWHLFRRLPLTDDYTGELPICATFGAGPIKLEAEVTGKETLEVPAGTFECYKLLVKPVQQTFWISTGPERYSVKFEAGGVSGVLQSIRQVKPGDTIKYSDADLGFSVSAPADWYFIPDKVSTKEPAKLVILMDPEAEAVSMLHVVPRENLKEEHRASVRAWAEEEVVDLGKAHKDFQVRAGSWKQREVGGHPAVSCVADFLHGERKRAQYAVFILGKATATFFAASTEPDRLEPFSKKLDKIVDSYEAK